MHESSVRRLSTQDLPLVRRLAAELLGESGVPNEPLIELLEDSRSIVLAAVQAGEPVGYLVAYCFPSLSGERLAYLYDIEVVPERRRAGVAKALVHQLLGACRAIGVESIWVGSSLTNVAACELWRTTGATRDGDQNVEFTYEL